MFIHLYGNSYRLSSQAKSAWHIVNTDQIQYVEAIQPFLNSYAEGYRFCVRFSDGELYLTQSDAKDLFKILGLSLNPF